MLDDNEDLDNRVKRDKEIYEMGFEPDLDYITSTYGGKWSKRTPSTTPATQESTDFAEGNPNAIDRAVEDGMTDWQPMMDPVLQPILDLVEGAASFEEIKARLPEIYGDMDVSKVRETLARLTFATEVATRAGADLDGND